MVSRAVLGTLLASGICLQAQPQSPGTQSAPFVTPSPSPSTEAEPSHH